MYIPIQYRHTTHSSGVHSMGYCWSVLNFIPGIPETLNLKHYCKIINYNGLGQSFKKESTTRECLQKRVEF